MEQLLQQLTQVTPTSVWEWFLGDPLMVVSTILAAVILRWVLNRSIARIVDVTIAKHDARRERVPGRAGRVLAQATGLDHERHRQRTLTMGSLLRSIVTFVVTLVTVLTVMAIVGIPLGPLLASAGVGGVALGFGAQSLVKDFLSGIFMILEDQYGVGDVIDTGEAIGTVEEVTLRVTRLRDGSRRRLVRPQRRDRPDRQQEPGLVDRRRRHPGVLRREPRAGHPPHPRRRPRAIDQTPAWQEQAPRGAPGGRRRVDRPARR